MSVHLHAAPRRRPSAQTIVRGTAVAAAVVAVFGVLASAAGATAPGVPGDIVFQRYLGPDNSQGAIYTISPDGTGERQVTSSPPGMTDRFPDFGPHSEQIAFQRCTDFCQVMTVRAEGTDLRALTTMCAPGQIPPDCTDNFYPCLLYTSPSPRDRS